MKLFTDVIVISILDVLPLARLLGFSSEEMAAVRIMLLGSTVHLQRSTWPRMSQLFNKKESEFLQYLS